MNRNYPHFAIPEIYGESLSYYELLRKLVKAMNVMIDNYNTVPNQIAEEVKNLDASQLFSTVLNQLIHSIATDNTKSTNAVKVYKKHDLLYATFNETVNLYESMIDFSTGTATELIPGTNIREVNISELFIELRKLIDINKNNIEAVTLVANENSAEIATIHRGIKAVENKNSEQDNEITTIHNDITAIENKNTEQDNELSALRTMLSSPYKFKGKVASISALPSSGEVNDTYYVQDVKYKVTWTGSAWVQSSLSEADYQTELSELKSDLDYERKYVEYLKKGIKLLKHDFKYGSVSFDTGEIVEPENKQRLCTDFIEVIPNNIIVCFNTEANMAWFDEEKRFISSIYSTGHYSLVPSNAKYLRQNIKSGDSFDISNIYEVGYYIMQTTVFDNDNLLSITNFKHGVYDSGNGTIQYRDSDFCTGLINVKPNNVYKTNLGELVHNKFKVFMFNYNKEFIDSINLGDNDYSIEIPDNVNYISFNIIINRLNYNPDLRKLYLIYDDARTYYKLKSLESKKSIEYSEIRVFDFYKENKSHSDSIDEAISFSRKFENRTIVFDTIDWHISRAILLPSNTTVIIDGVSIIQNDNVYDNVFRGDNLILDTNNPNGMPLEVKEISNIKILGKNDAKIIGCSVNAKGVHSVTGLTEEKVGDFWGWRTLQVCLSRCNNFEIGGINFEKTRCWCLSFDKSSNGYIHDLNIISNVKNGDGIDIRSGCHDIVIENIYGNTSDDTVAITAIYSGTSYPIGNYQYPLEPSLYLNDSMSIQDLGIKNITVKNIKTTGEHHGVICLCNSGYTIKNILIDSVEDIVKSTRQANVKIYSGYGSGYNENDISDVRINNIVSNGADYGLYIPDIKVFNLWANKIVQNKIGASTYLITNKDDVIITNS